MRKILYYAGGTVFWGVVWFCIKDVHIPKADTDWLFLDVMIFSAILMAVFIPLLLVV